MRSLVLDTSVIDPAYPDYDEIRQLVDEALDPPAPANEGGNGAGNGATAAPSTAAEPSDPAEAPTPRPGRDPVDDVRDACAYDPAAAAKARAEGEPPTR